MKKKITLMLSLILAVCMLCACGQDPKTVDYNGKSYDDLASETVSEALNDFYIMSVIGQTEGYEDYNFLDLTKEQRENLVSQGLTEVTINAMVAWAELEETYGKCTDFDLTALPSSEEEAKIFSKNFANAHEFSVTKAGETVTTDMLLTFGDRKVTFELVYDYFDMNYTAISLTEVKSMGEKMGDAGKNTIISMSIVFSVLILISLIISCFKIFAVIENKKKASAPAVEAAAVTEAIPVAAPQTDDSELIAVIAAAIAASEGTSTSDFVVRSINRR